MTVKSIVLSLLLILLVGIGMWNWPGGAGAYGAVWLIIPVAGLLGMLVLTIAEERTSQEAKLPKSSSMTSISVRGRVVYLSIGIGAILIGLATVIQSVLGLVNQSTDHLLNVSVIGIGVLFLYQGYFWVRKASSAQG